MNPQPELLLHIVARIKESPEAAAEFERSISFLLGQGDGATAILTVRHLIAGGWNGLLPVSRTPSLGVMMKPEVVHGDETDV